MFPLIVASVGLELIIFCNRSHTACCLMPLERMEVLDTLRLNPASSLGRTFDQPRPECHSHLGFDVLVSLLFLSPRLPRCICHFRPLPRLHRHEVPRLTCWSSYRERQTRVMYATIFCQRAYAHCLQVTVNFESLLTNNGEDNTFLRLFTSFLIGSTRLCVQTCQ